MKANRAQSTNSIKSVSEISCFKLIHLKELIVKRLTDIHSSPPFLFVWALCFFPPLHMILLGLETWKEFPTNERLVEGDSDAFMAHWVKYTDLSSHYELIEICFLRFDLTRTVSKADAREMDGLFHLKRTYADRDRAVRILMDERREWNQRTWMELSRCPRMRRSRVSGKPKEKET